MTLGAAIEPGGVSTMHLMRRPLLLLASTILLALLARPAGAQDFLNSLGNAAPGGEKAAVDAAANLTAAQPGQQVVVAVTLDVVKGWKAQSNQPLTPGLIAFNVRVGASDQLTAYAPLYAEPTVMELGVNGEVSVFGGRTVHYVPIEISPDAEPGTMLLIDGIATVQVCDDSLCLPPKDVEWSISLPIVADAASVEPANAAVFDGFDPSVWSRLKPMADAPTTLAAGSSGTAFKLFGFELDLANFGPAMILLLAFVAGILFNVVPCVLPVLPMKIIGFYETAQHSRSRCFALGVAFSVGMTAVFVVLAVLLFGFSETLGFTWGAQFSNPWFSGTMALLLLIFALYQFGLLTFVLPAKVYSITPRHDTYAGNIGFGAMTAVLSTPCTFGLFAALLAWAATQPTWLGIAAVSTTGLGMASPYLILSLVPEVARKFPRTGKWSEIIKQTGGFLVLAVAFYFAWAALRVVLPKAIVGPNYWWIVFAPVAAGCVFLVIAAVRMKSPRGILVCTITAAVLVGATLPVFWRLANPPAGWTYFSETALAEARASNRPVLVKFTADWCLNCQTVEQRVFGTQEQVDAWADGYNLRLIKVDLTQNDAPGWDLLSELNPARAIPFTAVYLPGEDRPRALTGIYGSDDLRDALE